MRLSTAIALIALVNLAAADIVIQQVLYDPVGTESGGEAVEVLNTGSVSVDIGGYRLATARSASDALIPAGTILKPGGAYLIADAGWNASKDDVSWRPADLEEAITLNNKDSGVALLDAANITIDAIGWGDAQEIPDGLYEGTPFSPSGTGAAWRLRDSGNNSVDVEGRNASFPDEQEEDGFTVWLNVSRSAFDAVIDDDLSDEQGIQWKPSSGVTRMMRVVVGGAGENATVLFNDVTVRLRNGTADMPLPFTTPPGKYDLVMTDGGQVSSISITVLPLRSALVSGTAAYIVGVPGRPAILKAAAMVRNTGNVEQEFLLESDGREALLAAALLLQVGSDVWLPLLDVPRVRLGPGESAPLGVRIDVPGGTKEGVYKTVIRVRQN